MSELAYIMRLIFYQHPPRADALFNAHFPLADTVGQIWKPILLNPNSRTMRNVSYVQCQVLAHGAPKTPFMVIARVTQLERSGSLLEESSRSLY
jgi:hypothetical protein